MDLPADKMKMLREFPSEKKWDIIRDSVSERRFRFDFFKIIYTKTIQDQVIAKHPPQYYIDGLKRYIRGANLVPKASTLVRKFTIRKKKENIFFQKKKQPIEPSTQLLSSLEISLRTNNIG